jgi:hypothetical protein
VRLYREGVCKTRVKTQNEIGFFEMSWANICAWHAAGYRYFIAYDATTGWYVYGPLTMLKNSCYLKLGVIPSGKKRPIIVFRTRINSKSKYNIWKRNDWATTVNLTRSQYYLSR